MALYACYTGKKKENKLRRPLAVGGGGGEGGGGGYALQVIWIRTLLDARRFRQPWVADLDHF